MNECTEGNPNDETWHFLNGRFDAIEKLKRISDRGVSWGVGIIGHSYFDINSSSVIRASPMSSTPAHHIRASPESMRRIGFS